MAIFLYKVNNHYNKIYEKGIAFNDPDLGINWRLNQTDFKISLKNKNQNSFKKINLKYLQ